MQLGDQESQSQQGEQRTHLKSFQAAMLGQRGGYKAAAGRSSQERSALARHAARARWHPLEAKAVRERAEEITQLVRQALKNGNQLPLN